MLDAKTTPPGAAISGGAKIPIREMALASLEHLFPHLTAEQIACLREGRPVPPSPDYVDPDVVQLVAEPEKPADWVAARVITLFDATINLAATPTVTAILVVSNPEHTRRARKAVAQFVAQKYPHKQLVIVNATGGPITTIPHAKIKELVYPDDRGLTVGEMRNYGIENANGDLLYPHWDDDDVYDPYLLAYMMAGFVPGKAVALTTQLRIDLETGNACLHTELDGIPNTMIVPNHGYKPYELKTGGEDATFWAHHWSTRAVVLDNRAWPVASLKICVHDRVNVLPRAAFMVAHSDSTKSGQWELPEVEILHMQSTMAAFGIAAGLTDQGGVP